MLYSLHRSTILLLIAATGAQALADKSVYSFGGSCVSQGSWTKAALAQTQVISEAIDALSKDPNCTGLQQTIVDLPALQQTMATGAADANKVERFESIPGNLDALRAASTDPTLDKNAVADVALNETVDGAGLAMSAANTATTISAGPEAAVAAMAVTLGKRTRDAALRGMDILDRLTTALPNYTKCAQASANQGQIGTLLAATIQMAGAYSGSGSENRSRVANTLSRLVTMVQQQHFAKALRTLNDIQYRMSMSCLLETTSQNFCDADDARKVLKIQVRNMGMLKNGQDSPVEGIFLLSRDIPNIAAWLKRVQFGFIPKTTSDSDFKNKILTNFNNLLMSYYSIRGKFNEDLMNYRNQPDLVSKQSTLFNTLTSIVAQLGGGQTGGGFGPAPGSSQGVNFVTQVIIPEMIPFYLVGIKEIPGPVASNDKGGFVMSWDQWMKGKGGFENVPAFATPDKLIVDIERNLDALLDEASKRASLYLMSFLIVDHPNLVSELVADQNLTVVESLRRVYKFLDRLDKKIVASANVDPLNGDFRSDLLAMRPAVAETAGKIRKLLESLGSVMRIAIQKPEELNLSPDDYQKKVNELYKNVIETAFAEFNVQFQRETMLAIRMGNFVRADFATKVRYRDQMSDDERNLMVTYGRDMLDKIMQNSGFSGDMMNPQAVETDLDTAQTVNMANLVALEKFFKDQLYKTIMELNKTITVGASEVAYRNSLQSWKERMSSPATKYNPASYYFWKWAPQVSSWEARKINGLRFESFFKDVYGADDVEGSIAKFRARLCIQTLAFQDKARFRDICRGAEVKSIFAEIDPKAGLSANYDALYDQFTKDDRSMIRRGAYFLPNNGAPGDVNKTGKNVCAWRDYNRRNLVYWLTKKLHADEEN